MKKILRLKFLIPAAVVCILVVAMAAASNITSSDPLVSLSYLTGTLKDQMFSELQTEMQSQSSQLEAKLTQRVSGIRSAVSTPAAAAATHSSVTVPANSSYVVPSGSEFLFISGTAAPQSAGLTDLTDGTAAAAQTELLENHLYSATTSVTIKAAQNARILIRK